VCVPQITHQPSLLDLHDPHSCQDKLPSSLSPVVNQHVYAADACAVGDTPALSAVTCAADACAAGNTPALSAVSVLGAASPQACTGERGGVARLSGCRRVAALSMEANHSLAKIPAAAMHQPRYNSCPCR